MMKQKIFFLSTSLNIGGTEKFLVQLVENLGSEYAITVGYLKEKGALGDYLSTKGIPVVHCSGFIGLYKVLKAGNYAVIHTFLYRANILGRIAGKLAGVPAVISTRQAIDIWRKPYQVFLDIATERFSDIIIANSQATRQVLISKEKVSPEKIRVVYNGVNFMKLKAGAGRNEVRSSLGIPADKTVAVSVSRLHYDKGTDFIPAIIASADPGILFLIVGDGPARRPLQSELKKRGLADRCILTGWRNDIGPLLNAADVFFLPSREESFPQAVLEAMAQQLPVIAADVGGLKELVDHKNSGILVPVGDTGGFSRALNELVSPELRSRMGSVALDKARHFTEESMLRKMRSVYEEALHSGTGQKE